ncbi:unnamed protein product [Diatraea saccharalis]|uniref:Cadherin domain-containing protein n=1 Tax=Diatraea saccharalis TaxID=40085 RepID=A0A9N9N1P3_9NEOP|nr:unnamed protein product [Diatraea saccharalis]
MNGGAVESFFISEDTPVGSVIGTLSVNGDPSESGDITLRLQEVGAAVGIAAGTRNLTLLRPLDREEARGPSNVYVNVRCDRRRTTDPSFIIPVSVRVWDVNDNAPAWAGAPYALRVSELTAVGARVLQPRATDADQPGPHATVHYSVLPAAHSVSLTIPRPHATVHYSVLPAAHSVSLTVPRPHATVHYSVLPAAHSEYLGFLNELDSVLVVKKPLDYETLKNFTITLRAQDQGTPPLHNDTTLEVEVLDADDQNPKFSHEHYSAIIPDDAEPGTILETSPGPISAVDQDTGIDAPLQYSATGDHRHLLALDRDTGALALTAALLRHRDPLTVVIKATQVDNPDRYALATLSLSRAARAAPARAVRFTRRQYDAAVPEDAAPAARLLTLHTEPPATPTVGIHADTPPRRTRIYTSSLQFYVSDRSFLEKFAIDSAGEVLLRRPLDYETTDSYHYQVMVTDGDSNDTASINITVLNVNEWEPRFRYPQYEFHVDGDPRAAARLLPAGRLDVYDGDKPDTVALTLRGPDANMLEVNELGEVFLRGEMLPALNSSTLHALATARDSGHPPRQCDNEQREEDRVELTASKSEST